MNSKVTRSNEERKLILQETRNAPIPNYTVTPNHIHMLVLDEKGRDVIPQSIKLVAGRTAQEYNCSKNRKGAFGEDRYHATAVESKDHLLRCLVYINLNMVRTGVISHPSEWSFGGYNEIQKPRRKSVLIAYQKLAELTGFGNYDTFQKAHKEFVRESLANGDNIRQIQWTESIAVGSQGFINTIKDDGLVKTLNLHHNVIPAQAGIH